ncbi:DHH family phosphoesterase [Streptomyces sp. NPDC002659]|uniref:DHH family phosphoesterase n=1 Tax=Streptomyces sp. NPDC002659 TaxID=3364656 RepID=UPI0036A92888
MNKPVDMNGRQQPGCYVFSYVNPDTDGVGSALGYAEWARRVRGETYTPVLWGVLDAVTRTALRHFAVQAPTAVAGLPRDCRVVLVDTHHLAQLPACLDPRQVVEVIDHHPHGDTAALPNARVQNEAVGAAATLVAERFDAAGILPSPPVAGLLASAIVCSTWNLTAPTTSDRDRDVLDSLRAVSEFPAAFAKELMAALDDAPAQDDTSTLLLRHAKRFRFGAEAGGHVVIAQIECSSTTAVTERGDLRDSILAMARHEEADHCFVSVVGLAEGVTVVVCPEPRTRTLLEQALHLTFIGDVACEHRRLLRKTDYVPRLGSHFGRPDEPGEQISWSDA